MEGRTTQATVLYSILTARRKFFEIVAHVCGGGTLSDAHVVEGIKFQTAERGQNNILTVSHFCLRVLQVGATSTMQIRARSEA